LGNNQGYAVIIALLISSTSIMPSMAQSPSNTSDKITISGADLAVFEYDSSPYNGFFQAFNVSGYNDGPNRITGIDVFLNGVNLGSPPTGCCYYLYPAGQQWSAFWGVIPFTLTVGETYSIAVIANFSDGDRAFAFAEVSAAICDSLLACPQAGASVFSTTAGLAVLDSTTSAVSTMTIFQPTSCPAATATTYLTSDTIKQGSICYAVEYTTQSSVPVEGAYFAEYIEVEWTGDGPTNAPSTMLSLGSTLPGGTEAVPSWSSAEATCNLAGEGKIVLNPYSNYYVSVTLQPDVQTWLTYQCNSAWGFVDSGFDGNVVQSDISAASTSFGLVLSTIATKGASAVSGLLDIGTQVYGIFNDKVVLAVDFALGFGAGINALYLESPNVDVLAPGQKWTAWGWWLGAKLAFLVATATLDVAMAIAGASCAETGGAGCVVAIAIGIGSFIAGEALDQWGQKQVGDPSANYTELVPPPSLPSGFNRLGNTTATQLLTAGYLFIASMNDSVESNALASGALHANSSHYAELQEAGASEYAANASIYYSKYVRLLATVLTQMNDSGQFSAEAFQTGQKVLTAGNLPANLTSLLNELGLPSTVVAPDFAGIEYRPLSINSSLSLTTNPSITLWKGDLESPALQTSVTSTTSVSSTTSSSASSGGSIPEFAPSLSLLTLVTLVVIVAYVLEKHFDSGLPKRALAFTEIAEGSVHLIWQQNSPVD
jgi:hypothetical protein